MVKVQEGQELGGWGLGLDAFTKSIPGILAVPSQDLIKAQAKPQPEC